MSDHPAKGAKGAPRADEPRPGEPLTHALGAAGPLRVLIVEDDTVQGLSVRAQLGLLGHTVTAHVSGAAEAVEQFRAAESDLVLMDIRLEPGEEKDGIAVAAELQKIRRVPVIIISGFSDPGLVDRANDAGVFAYLIKPVNLELLQVQIEVAVRRFREYEQLRAENEQLLQNLEARKLMEKAKGIFMKRLGLSEPDAHRRLQQESQRRRLSLTDLCKKVIESEELLGGNAAAALGG